MSTRVLFTRGQGVPTEVAAFTVARIRRLNRNIANNTEAVNYRTKLTKLGLIIYLSGTIFYREIDVSGYSSNNRISATRATV